MAISFLDLVQQSMGHHLGDVEVSIVRSPRESVC
jgi:hypothetical protein